MSRDFDEGGKLRCPSIAADWTFPERIDLGSQEERPDCADSLEKTARFHQSKVSSESGV